MSTHASAHRQWTAEEIERLTPERGFRLRGLEVTRLDTFIDATFAFVLTLLVISFDELPQTYEEMMAAAKRIPAFAASFAMLMMFWLQHRQWSRRYALETPRTLALSLALIFMVLVYVYPLRTVIAAMFAQFSGGWLPAGFSVTSVTQLRGLFVFYSAGFLAMCLIMRQLLSEALSARDALRLDAKESLITRTDRSIWDLCAVTGVASILLALTLPDLGVPLAGYVYWTLAIAIPVLSTRLARALATLENGTPD